MMRPSLGLWGLLVVIGLGAAACSSTPTVRTQVLSAGLTSAVSLTNEPENKLTEVPAGASVIYLAVQIGNPTRGTQVRVRWVKLPNEILSTEDFVGNRTENNPFEFDRNRPISSLASRLIRQEPSWELGDYRAEVWLDGRLANTIPFVVVSDADASQLSAQRLVRQITLSDELINGDQLGPTRLTFQRATNAIHIRVGLSQPLTNADMQTSVRYVKDDQIITTFTTGPTSAEALIFTLTRERFGRLWSDNLWPTGTFEVTVRVGGILARSQTFQII